MHKINLQYALSLIFGNNKARPKGAKFARFAKEIWGVATDGKTKEVIAEQGLNAMENFLNECGIETSLKELGATKEMLPKIAESTVILCAISFTLFHLRS